MTTLTQFIPNLPFISANLGESQTTILGRTLLFPTGNAC